MKFIDKLPPRKELTKRRDDAAKEIERGVKDKQKSVARLGEAEKRRSEIDKQYTLLREQRRNLMVQEKDKEAEDVEKQIGELEKADDRTKEFIEALKKDINDCDAFAARAEAARKAAEEQLVTLSLYELLDEWNATAPALARIALKLHLKTKELHIPLEKLPGLPFLGNNQERNKYGALETIPRFAVEGILRHNDQHPGALDRNEKNIGELSFFDAEMYERNPDLFKELQ
jgi:hypothetical protein